MKKYFLHNGTESSGPFDLEELKAKKITKSSPIWFEGMTHWQTAGEIPELNFLFIVNPPPISKLLTKEFPKKDTLTPSVSIIFGMPKIIFLVIFGVVITIISTIVLSNLREQRSEEIETKNRLTEIENRRLEEEQKELEKQKKEQEDADKLAAVASKEIAKLNDSDRLIEIEKIISISQSNLEAFKSKLKATAGLDVFESEEEKNDALYELQKSIDSIRSSVDALKVESNQLKLKLEKHPK